MYVIPKRMYVFIIRMNECKRMHNAGLGYYILWQLAFWMKLGTYAYALCLIPLHVRVKLNIQSESISVMIYVFEY